MDVYKMLTRIRIWIKDWYSNISATFFYRNFLLEIARERELFAVMYLKSTMYLYEYFHKFLK